MKNSKGMIFLFAGLASLTLMIAVAYFFFSREQTPPAAPVAPVTTPAPATTPLPNTFDPVEWSRQSQNAPTEGLSAPEKDVPSDGFVVTMPQDDPVAFPDDNTATDVRQVEFPEPVAKTPAPAPVAKPAPKATPKPAAPAKTTPKPATITVTEYWIQVGAFKDRYQAEASAKTLEAEGLKGTLTTVPVNGVTVVRVRVGPYATKDEAEKFLAWIKPVKGLENSYVTATKATRTK